MTALTAQQVKDLIIRTQHCYQVIQHENWDAANRRYRTHDTAMWQEAAFQAVPTEHQEWREMVRVLAQGESYYGGSY
jgi:hypothetical protein